MYLWVVVVKIVDFSDIESRILSLELEALFRSLSDALNWMQYFYR